ncbi:MAG: hypothetical protein QOG53_2136 [Frankiales bacterium]|jgi:hypothetical protein|nr:hypothetical protein [Frankiales bacterium]
MRSISDIRARLAEVAAEFDASTIPMGRCREIVAEAAAIERMAAAVKTQAAARVAQSGSWRESGDRSAAHELARETGTTVGAAREALETGARLRDLPELAAAARRGDLSPTQTASVAGVGAVAPELVPGLIERAQNTTVAQLREECARALASREPDLEARRRQIREQRSLRHWVDASGAGVLQLRDAVDVIAGVMTDLAPVREALFQQARKRGDRLSPEAADADALVAAVAAARHGNPPSGSDDLVVSGRPADTRRPPHRCAPRAKILIRVDFDALLRGRPIVGEVCEIAGYGPVAVSAVRELLATGDAFLAGIISKGEKVVGVAHLGRRATAMQATALEWTNPTCAADGCTRAIRLEIDHRKPWAPSKITLTELLDRLCEHDHDLKTRKGWGLVEGTGKRPFVPPTDPRHPNNVATRNANRTRGDPHAA